MRVAREWRSAKMTSQKIYICSEYINGVTSCKSCVSMSYRFSDIYHTTASNQCKEGPKA